MITSTRTEQTDRSVSTQLSNRLFRANQAILAVLQGVYKDRPKGNRCWSPDPEVTDIHIVGVSPEEVQNPGVSPVISVTRTQSHNMGVARDLTTDRSMLSRDMTFGDLVQCSSLVTVLCQFPVEAEDLAYEIKVWLQLFRDIVVRKGCMHNMMNGMTLSAPSPGPQSSTYSRWSQVTISVPWVIQEEFRVVVADPLYQVLVRSVEVHVDTMLP